MSKKAKQYSATEKTEPLPANAGRFVISMGSNVIEDSFISNITASRAKVPPRPKSSTPISLTQFYKLLLDFA